jgi:hypothetical protein
MEAAFCDGNVFSECTDYKEDPNGYVCCDELPENYVFMNYMYTLDYSSGTTTPTVQKGTET